MTGVRCGSKNKWNIGVTFLSKLGLSFHIEIRGFCGFYTFRNLQFFKIHEICSFSNFAKPVVLKIHEIRSFCAEIRGFYQNPRILQSWGLGISSSKVFQTKDQQVQNLTGFEIMQIIAFGEYFAHPSAKSRTMDAFVLKRSSRVIPKKNT